MPQDRRPDPADAAGGGVGAVRGAAGRGTASGGDGDADGAAALLARLCDSLGADRCRLVDLSADGHARLEASSSPAVSADGVGGVDGTGHVNDPDGTPDLAAFGAGIPAVLRSGRSVAVDDGGDAGPPGVAAWLLAPVARPGRALRVLVVECRQPHAWRPGDAAAARAAGEAAAEALERTRVARRLATNEARLAAVLEALPVGVAIADADGAVLQENAAHRALWGPSPPTGHWQAYHQWVGYEPATGERLAPDAWPMARVLLHGEPVRGRVVEIQPFGTGPRRHVLFNAAPVRDASGRLVGGVLAEFDVTEARAAELEHERLLASERRARERLEQLQQLTAALSAARTPADVARATVEVGARMVGARIGGIWRLVDGDRRVDTFERIDDGLGDALPEACRRVPRRLATPAREAARRLAPVLAGDPETIARDHPDVAALHGPDLPPAAAIAAFPLLVGGSASAPGDPRDGVLIGVVAFDFDRPTTFGEDERAFLSALAELCAQALDRARLLEGERSARLQLEGLLQAVSDGFFALDRDWRVIYMNPQAERLLGVASGTLVGRSLWDVYASAVGTRFETEYRAAMDTGRPTAFEAYFAPMKAWFDVRAHPGPQGLAVYFQDVTERHEAAERLRDGEARLRAIFEHAPVGLVFAEAPGGRIVAANRRAEAILGTPRAAVRSMEDYGTAFGAVHDDGRPYRWDDYPLAQVLTGAAGAVDAEMRYRRPDGRVGWVRASAAPLRDDQGRHVGGMVALLDIDQEREATEGLRRTQLRLELALDAGGMGVWDWSPQDGEARWSPHMYTLLGLPPDPSGRGSGEGFIDRVHPDDRARIDTALSRALAQGGSYELEHRILRADGEVRWLLGRGRVIRDGTGRVLRMVGVNLDITERKAAEQALLETDRRRNEFLAMLGHELRNPLAPIANAVRLLERDDGQLEHRSAAVRIIRRQVQHLARLVDDLLEVSRVTQGRIDLRHEHLPAAGPILAAVEAVRPLVRQQGQRLDVDVPPDLDLVVDPARLTQVVANLLNNAAKYTPPGGHIVLAARADGPWVWITVTDDGAGIEPALLPRVFDLFSQGETTLDRSRGGLGLGLALVKRLVELHGGHVAASSPGPGRGATFTVRLPRHERRQAPRGAEAGLTGRLSPMPILVVDDNVDAAESLGVLLEADGHRVRLAHDGDMALDVARRFRPRAVLLDIGLPGRDGFEVARALRADPEVGEPVIVALSGYGEQLTRERGHDGLFDAQLLKPATLDDVYRAIAGAGGRAGRRPDG